MNKPNKRSRVRPFILPLIILLLIILSGLLHNINRTQPIQGSPFSVEDAKRLYPDASIISGAANVFTVEDKKGNIIGQLLYGPSEEVTGHVAGVPFLISIDKENRLGKLTLLENMETPRYSERVEEEYQSAWSGMLLSEASHKEVDTLTGATNTSRALILGVRSLASDLAGEEQYGFLSTVNPLIYALSIVFIFLTLMTFLSPKICRGRRKLFLLLRVLIPGFLTAQMLSLVTLESFLRGSVRFSSHLPLIILLMLALLIPLITGRNYYCYCYCPFGAAQDLIRSVSPFKKKFSNWSLVVLLTIRIIMVTLAFLILFDLIGLPLSEMEPFSAFRWAFASTIVRVIALGSLILAVLFPRPWCRICPTGGIIDSLRLNKN